MTSKLVYTPLEEIAEIHATLQRTFLSGKLRPAAYRKEQLLQVAYLLQDNEDRLGQACFEDLGRPLLETSMLEIVAMIAAAVHAVDNLKKWMKPERAPFDMVMGPLRPTIHKEPKGVGLIISPFNFPIWCSISPLIGAIAAGCPAVCKLSELTPAVSSLMAELFPQYLDPEAYRIVNGSVEETTKLLDLRWDQIFFTGSGRVGRVVAAAAAQNLTPVSLELGGKNPVFIDRSCDMDLAARRVLWGKTSNAGQLCIAPDYVLVPRDIQDDFLRAVQKAHGKFYPEEQGGPAASKSFSRIVNETHLNRLKTTLTRSEGETFIGGEIEAAQKYLAPTVVKDVPKHDALMENEVFGPILPVVPVADLQEAIDFVKNRDSPMAVYVFTSDHKVANKVFENTRSGSFAVNEVLLQGASEALPFGGTGASGYGSHLGKHSFDQFTHLRSAVDSPTWLDLIMSPRFPPYSEKRYKFLLSMMRTRIRYARPGTKPSLLSRAMNVYVGAAVAIALAALALTRL